MQAFVPLLATAKVLGGFGLTEPGAGSDAGGTSTAAVDKGDHYVLNGSKTFITHGGVGEIFVATARTDPTGEEDAEGITSFIVTKDTSDRAEAARVGMGHDDAFAEDEGLLGREEGGQTRLAGFPTPASSIFQDAIVPKENVLGPLNNGFRQFLHTL